MNTNDNIQPSNPEEANDLFDQQEEFDDIQEMERAPLQDEREDQFRDDVEADADALASAGWGEDEAYGGCDGGDW